MVQATTVSCAQRHLPVRDLEHRWSTALRARDWQGQQILWRISFRQQGCRTQLRGHWDLPNEKRQGADKAPADLAEVLMVKNGGIADSWRVAGIDVA
jgi:hypothetical protein